MVELQWPRMAIEPVYAWIRDVMVVFLNIGDSLICAGC